MVLTEDGNDKERRWRHPARPCAPCRTPGRESFHAPACVRSFVQPQQQQPGPVVSITPSPIHFTTSPTPNPTQPKRNREKNKLNKWAKTRSALIDRSFVARRALSPVGRLRPCFLTSREQPDENIPRPLGSGEQLGRSRARVGCWWWWFLERSNAPPHPCRDRHTRTVGASEREPSLSASRRVS